MDKELEWEQYTKIFNLDEYFGRWQLYFWRKDKNNNVVMDLSEENIKRCEDIYNQNKNDEHSLLRLWLLKNFADEKCSKLDNKILSFADKNRSGGISIINCFLEDIAILSQDNSDIFGAIKPYLPKLKDFFMVFIEKESRHIMDRLSLWHWEREDVHDIVGLSIIVGYSAIFRCLDCIEIVLKGAIYLSGGISDYLQEYEESFYATFAEYCFINKMWIEAYCLYEALSLDIDAVKKEQLCPNRSEFEIFNLGVNDSWRDVSSSITVEEVEKRVKECLVNALNYDSDGRAHSIIKHWFRSRVYASGRIYKLQRKVENDNQLYKIFKEILRKEYDNAYEIWNNWDSRDEVELFGINVKDMDYTLKKMKKTKNKNLMKDLLDDIYVQGYAIHNDLETKIRKFVIGNLKIEYGRKYQQWWGKGIPKDIRVEAVKKRESNLTVPIEEYLNFYDYIKIMSKKENWNNIFKDYFQIKKDAKSKDAKLDFLKEANETRNIIMHMRSGFKKKDLNKLKQFHEMFNAAYSKWNEECERYPKLKNSRRQK
jgi:hypothetical protein